MESHSARSLFLNNDRSREGHHAFPSISNSLSSDNFVNVCEYTRCGQFFVVIDTKSRQDRDPWYIHTIQASSQCTYTPVEESTDVGNQDVVFMANAAPRHATKPNVPFLILVIGIDST
jgi:hypothetical protein